MKVLLLLCIIYILHRTVVSDDDPKKGVSAKIFPKKVHRRQILINKLKNLRRHDSVQEKTKKPSWDSQKYTVFPKMNAKYPFEISIPESPYFEQEDKMGSKPSVKKVLPSYSRLKRSVDTKALSKKGKPISDAVSKKTFKKAQALITKTPIGHKPVGRALRKSNHRKSRKRHLRNRKNRNVRKSRKGKKHSKALRKRPSKGRKHESPVKPSRRLVGARDTPIEDYPYVVSIQKDHEHWCAGALLNQRIVITTANCVWKSKNMSRMRIRAGSRDTYRGGQTAKVQQVMKHPLWSARNNPDYDIALLLLDRNLIFSHSIHGVDLPNRAMMPSFDDAWVTSWGAERRDGVYDRGSVSLQAYHARLMTREKCNNITERFGVLVSPNFICLAQTGKKAPCTRDTGAPAVSDGVLYGLASWGIRKLCGLERFPSMFTYVASAFNMDFIINATKELMSEKRIYPFIDGYPVVRAKQKTENERT